MNLKSFIETYGDSFPYPVTIVNQDLPDQPLVYVNKYFRDLTGYENGEILGKNCRFLQSGKPDPGANKKIFESIRSRSPVCQDLLNYKKNGEAFYNRLVLIPFRTNGSQLYLGLQHDIPAEKYKPANNVPRHELVDLTIHPLSVMLGLELVADSRLNNQFQNMIGKIQNFVLSL